MPHKGAFEPKDARVTNMYEDEDDDDELDDWSFTSSSDVTPRPRRKLMTGTQALAEFLITTSPEEFQKSNPPKRSSNLFFRRRKNKHSRQPSTPSTTASSIRSFAPNTVQRMNHIEIVANDGPPSTSLARIASRTKNGSLISRTPVARPILPSNRSIKHRESSIYSESIRHSKSTTTMSVTANNNNNNNGTVNSNNYPSIRGRPLMRHDTGTTVSFGRRMSEHTFGGTLSNPDNSRNIVTAAAAVAPPPPPVHPSMQQQQQQYRQERDKRATEALVTHMASQELEVMEKALIQRLERFQLAKMDKPSDTVAAGLATEHIKALQASLDDQVETDNLFNHNHASPKRQVRHVQVQTMTSSFSDEPNNTKTSMTAAVEDTNTIIHNNNASRPTSSENEASLVEQLQRQLAHERQQRRQLQAALDETCDHFETLSGLAYKKLRELWEEKNHWENACIELRERLFSTSMLDQSHVQPPMDDALSGFPDNHSLSFATPKVD
ncbi:hypothetical protein K492DRAFT_234380 [Lichtheimia hyalospora FSU 10163]|nr:hypothetical protein K492DRAFT_234380 [Lichtheimia hyalospora FSU 10163]